MGSMEHHIYTIFLAAPWIMALKRSLFKPPKKVELWQELHFAPPCFLPCRDGTSQVSHAWQLDQWSNMIKYDQIWSNMIKWHHQTDIKQISNSYQTAKQLKTYAPGQDFYPALFRNVSHAWSLGVVPRPGVAEPSLPSHSSSFWIPSGYD